MRWDCRILGSFWDSGQNDAQLLQRFHHTAVVHNRINMYIFGGMGPNEQQQQHSSWLPTNEFLEYNLESGEYHLLNNDIIQLTSDLSFDKDPTYDSGSPKLPALSQHSMVLVGENQLFIYGGKGNDNLATNQLYRFDISNNHWYHLVHNDSEFVPPYRYGHSAVTIDDSSIYIFGGTDGRTYYSDLYILNTETLQWTVATTQGTAPEPRAGHSCVLYAGEQLYIFGGGNDEKIFNDLYCLDVNTLTWKKEVIKGNIEPVKRTYHTANVIASKMILLGGNMSTSNITSPNNFMILDLENKRWEYGIMDSRPNQAPPLLYGHSAVLSGAKLWVIGGKNASLESNSSETVSQCVYTLDTGIQGIEPIDYGRSTLSYDLHALVNARDMMSDIVFEFNSRFYYGHKPFLRIRCPALHREYLKNSLGNDSTLNVNLVIEQLAMKKLMKNDFNGRVVKQGFANRISSEVFDAFLEYVYTDHAFVFEADFDNEPIIKDLAFIADVFKMERLYALCCQHTSSLESKQPNRKLIPAPELFNDMKKMFDLSQNFVPAIEESNKNAFGNSFFDVPSSAFERSVANGANSADSSEEQEPQTPSSTSSYMTNLSTNPHYSYCDIIFSVTCNNEYERIGAHRCVLISRSNFFHRMLSQHSQSNLELEITGIRPQVFKLVIEFLYTGNVTINFDVSVEMLIASEVYQLERLSLMCQGVIERRIHVHNVCRILRIADAYDIKHLRESCVYFIVHHMSQVKKTHPYRAELEIDLKKELKRKRKMYREQEGSGFYESSEFQFINSGSGGSNNHDKYKSNHLRKKRQSKIRKAKHSDKEADEEKAKKKKRRSTKPKRIELEDSDSMSDVSASSPPVSSAILSLHQTTTTGTTTYSSILDDLTSSSLGKKRKGRPKLKTAQ